MSFTIFSIETDIEICVRLVLSLRGVSCLFIASLGQANTSATVSLKLLSGDWAPFEAGAGHPRALQKTEMLQRICWSLENVSQEA